MSFTSDDDLTLLSSREAVLTADDGFTQTHLTLPKGTKITPDGGRANLISTTLSKAQAQNLSQEHFQSCVLGVQALDLVITDTQPVSMYTSTLHDYGRQII
jgi:hypothetical protein